MHAALAVLLGLNGLRVSEACGTNIEDLEFERVHRTLQIVGKGNKPAGIPLVPARPARSTSPSGTNHGTATAARPRDPPRYPHCVPLVRCFGKRRGIDRVHPHMLRVAVIMAAPDAGVPLRNVHIAARHADLRTTTIYNRRRQNYDRHAADAVVAFATSG